MWELDHKEGWVLMNWCFWIMVLEKTLGSPLDSKKIKPAHSKGNQPWIFIGRTDDVAETPILWPPDTKSQLIGKDPDAGKDWGQEEKAEAEMVGWYHWLNGHELSKLREIVKNRVVLCAAVCGVTKSWMRLSDWTTKTKLLTDWTFHSYWLYILDKMQKERPWMLCRVKKSTGIPEENWNRKREAYCIPSFYFQDFSW